MDLDNCINQPEISPMVYLPTADALCRLISAFCMITFAVIATANIIAKKKNKISIPTVALS